MFVHIIGTYVWKYTASHLGRSFTNTVYLVLYTSATTTTSTTTTKAITKNHFHHHYDHSAITATANSVATLIANLIPGNTILINLLNPTGYVMYQQFNIQQLYVLPTLYLCVLYLSENKQRLVPLTA
jgi:hypothetical protein